MKLHFTKMNGLGNDFIIFDGRDHSLPEDLGALAKKVCDPPFWHWRRWDFGGASFRYK